MTEHQLQSAAIDYLRLTKFKNCFFSIPNGARRSLGCAAWMKKEGLQSGVPDLFIAYPSGNYHGLFVEFKTKRGSMSGNQTKWIEELSKNGYFVRVVRDIDDFIVLVNYYSSL